MKAAMALLIGLLVGTAVGYGASEIIRPLYQGNNVLTFNTKIVLTTNGVATVKKGTVINLTASLNASFPVQMVLEVGGRYLYQEKSVQLQAKVPGAQYWSIIDTEKTVYYNGCGEAYFNFTATETGDYSVKAVFTGTDLLVASESPVSAVAVTA